MKGPTVRHLGNLEEGTVRHLLQEHLHKVRSFSGVVSYALLIFLSVLT